MHTLHDGVLLFSSTDCTIQLMCIAGVQTKKRITIRTPLRSEDHASRIRQASTDPHSGMNIMASNIAIQDLALSKDLSAKELATVRGGSNAAGIGSQLQTIMGGGGILSPITNVGVYAPTVTQIGDTNIDVNLSSLTNVLGSLTAAVAQTH